VLRPQQAYSPRNSARSLPRCFVLVSPDLFLFFPFLCGSYIDNTEHSSEHSSGGGASGPESSGKNKHNLSVVIPNGAKDSSAMGSSKVKGMSPPPSFGIGLDTGGLTGTHFLQSPNQAFPSPTAFLSELQTPTNLEGSIDGMTPGALAQFSWNSPQGNKGDKLGTSLPVVGGTANSSTAVAATAAANTVPTLDAPPAKRAKTDES